MSTTETPPAADASRHLLSALWERGLPRLRERLDELDHAASSAAAGTLKQDARAHAAATAHKLAGSLGMFGYPEGTQLARQIEVLLEAADAADSTRLNSLCNQLRQTLKQ